MPRLRRPTPIGLALTAFELWRRLPQKQRRQILDLTRKHGPRLAAEAVKRTRGKSGRGRA